MLGRAEDRYHIIGDIVKSHFADARIVRAFVDIGVPQQGAGPGDATVGGVEQPDLGLLIGLYRLHHFHAHVFPGRASGDELVFNHPLDKTLAHHRCGVVNAGGRKYALAYCRRGTRGDAVHHGVGVAGVGGYPLAQRRIL